MTQRTVPKCPCLLEFIIERNRDPLALGLEQYMLLPLYQYSITYNEKCVLYKLYPEKHEFKLPYISDCPKERKVMPKSIKYYNKCQLKSSFMSKKEAISKVFKRSKIGGNQK